MPTLLSLLRLLAPGTLALAAAALPPAAQEPAFGALRRAFPRTSGEVGGALTNLEATRLEDL